MTRDEELDKAFTEILGIIFENKITEEEIVDNDFCTTMKEEAGMNK